MDLNDELNGLYQQVEKAKLTEAGITRVLTGGCDEHMEITFYEFLKAGGIECPVCMTERIRMLNDIALSAVALKLNLENGFTPSLHALNRDLAAFQARFGGLHDKRRD